MRVAAWLDCWPFKPVPRPGTIALRKSIGNAIRKRPGCAPEAALDLDRGTALVLLLTLLMSAGLVAALWSSILRTRRRLSTEEERVAEMRATLESVEDRLRETEHRWRSLADTLPLMVFTTTAEGLADYYNAQTLTYTGIPESELLGAGWGDVIHPDDREQTAKAWLVALQHQNVHEIQHRIRRWNGEYRWFTTRAEAVRDIAGRVFKWFGTSTDITSSKQLEEELRRAKELLELGIRGSNVAIFDFDMPDGRIENARQTMVNVWETLGYAPSEAPSAFLPGAMLAIHPDDLARVQREIGAYLAGVSQNFEAEYRVRHKDGSVLWRLARGTAFRDEDGTPIRFIGSFFDVTDNKQLEADLRHAKERLELAIRGANLCIWEYDMPDGSLESSRETLTNVWESFGYDVDDPPPSVASVVHPEDMERVGAQIAACLSGQTATFEVEHRVRHNDGSYHWILGRGVALRDAGGRPVRFVGTSVDINDIKRIEVDLLRAREAAEAANRAKDDFLANVSHEIRTPMNAILGMTELALDSARTEHQRQLLSTVRSAARNLLTIIDDLLDFSKITAGKLALDDVEFSLRAVLGDTVRALAARAHRKGLVLGSQVHPEVPDALFGDAGRLRQVLMNLISNALKFTTQGKVEVEVDVDSSDPMDGDAVTLCFAVRDTGIGIAREKQASIFRAFEQEDASTTRKYGGTGLGLTISSQLVTLMGGEISVDSEPGRGSTFRFTPRFVRSSAPASTALAPSPRPLENVRVLDEDDETDRGALVERLTEWRMSSIRVNAPTLRKRMALRILVAEDNELNVALLRELLTRDGHSVEFASDGRVALTFATEDRFDLLLLDLHMPELDGFDVARAIRERELGDNHLPIVALTARSSTRDREQCLEAGMDDFLSKPIEAGALWAAVDRVVLAFPPARRHTRLLDHASISRACGGQDAILGKLAEVFRLSLPDHMARVRAAFDTRDLSVLRGAAHMLNGTLSAFSPIAGKAASSLEDAAAGGEIGACSELVQNLEAMCAELLEESRTLGELGLLR